MADRNKWTELTDAQLLSQCTVDTYRASGPGGQKRNKTSSAVRIRHEASGLLVIAEESRSQHENRTRALKRLRQAFYLNLREKIDRDQLSTGDYSGLDDIRNCLDKSGRLHLGKKDDRFWPAVGIVLDVFSSTEARAAEAARSLGITTGNLIDFLQSTPKVWEQANLLRKAHGLRPLKNN